MGQMTKNRQKWYIYAKRADFYGIGSRFGIDPVAARVLVNRGICTEEEIDAFLNPDISRLNDPFLLPDMEKAAALLAEKIKAGKKIRIAGDYDADGVCAVYILYDAMRLLGADCSYVIPDRIKDGYGLNMSMITKAISDGIDTIVTCDNGISAFEELAAAKNAGLTVIVTDHHAIRKDPSGKEELPPADCVINAGREDSAYPEKNICGAVTAWKLVQALFTRTGRRTDEYLKYLEFAAIATVCDCMPLKGENRVITGEGLKILSSGGENAGIRALIEAAGLSGKKIGYFHTGFVIGPCINAGGRMESADRAMELFLSKSPGEAMTKAAYLINLNDSRKDLTIRGTEMACEAVRQKTPDTKVLVVCLDDLHESLAGIVAGRLKETYGKPAIVFTRSEAEGILKGSGRSIEKYDMFAGLSRCSGLLVKFGGHPMAAGLSIRDEDLPELEARLNEEAGLSEEDLNVKVWIDSEVPLSYLSEKLVTDLDRLEPFGEGNEKPLFAAREVHPANLRVMGKNRNALKMDLYTKEGFTIPGIMFGEADRLKEELSQKPYVNILYYPVINEWQGYRNLNVQIEDYL